MTPEAGANSHLSASAALAGYFDSLTAIFSPCPALLNAATIPPIFIFFLVLEPIVPNCQRQLYLYTVQCHFDHKPKGHDA